MTKAWLIAAATATVSLSTLLGCGSGTSDHGFGEDGSSDSDASVHDGGEDGTTQSDSPMFGSDTSLDTTITDTGPIRDTSGLDIAFPDGFTSPETGTSDTGSGDTGMMTGGCSPDGITCSGTTAITCTGGVETTAACTGKTDVCAAGYGCVVCAPGSGTCSGNTGTVCNSEGTGTTTNTCDPLQGLACLGGACTGDCADIGQSYIGCEYYAVTMSNPDIDQTTFTFVVSIANTGSTAASINIQGGGLAAAMTGTIAAGAIQEFTLPWVTALSTSTATTLDTGGAYHIRSTQPVTAYEFNARDYVIAGDYSYTNDASLLLPVNAMTGNYYVASYYSLDTSPAGIVIVGTQAGTSVTLAPSSAILAGGGMATTGGTITIGAGDVLQVANAGTGALSYGGDLSGSKVTASAPVEVFGSEACSYVPATVGYCDHLEQINFPLETLGKSYLVTVPYNDNDPGDTGHGRQYVKIIGTVAGTTLTYSPVITGAPTTVAAGGVVTFQATSDFEVTATEPIEVAQYMEGQDNFGVNCVDVEPPAGQTCGDPSMSLAVASAQFRTTYPFTSPQNYYENWANIIAPTGTTVTVTDTPTNHTITTGTAIGTSGYYVAHVSLCANNLAGCTGNHTATGTAAFGIQVYGYGSYTSYMYPGGLNLTR